jgi:lipid-A-disaccharide synthase
VDFYKGWGMDVDYVGNPLLDAIAEFKADAAFRKTHKLSDKKIIALLPGSRRQEISRLLPDMVAVAEKWPEYEFVIAGAPSFTVEYYDQYLKDTKLTLVFDATYDLLTNAHAAIVASGTATLETALFDVPQVVVYKGAPISIAIARMLVKIKFISLVNLIMNKLVVTELIQQDCNPQQINSELALIVKGGPGRQQMLVDYQNLHEKMGKPGASARTAELIITYSSKK